MKSLLIAIALLASTSLAAQTAQCKATTKAGTQCTRKAKADGFCTLHNPATIHCAGKTKAGKPCGRLPMTGSKYCFTHKVN